MSGLAACRAALRAAAGQLLQQEQEQEQEQDQAFGLDQQASILGEVRLQGSQTILGTQSWLPGDATPMLLHQLRPSGAVHRVKRMLGACTRLGR